MYIGMDGPGHSRASKHIGRIVVLEINAVLRLHTMAEVQIKISVRHEVC